MHLDQQVVEAERIDRRHDMLDRRDRGCRREAKDGAQIGVADLRRDGPEFAHPAAGKHTLEHDPGIGIGRLERELDFRTGVNANSLRVIGFAIVV